jgi:hypothetical protein
LVKVAFNKHPNVPTLFPYKKSDSGNSGRDFDERLFAGTEVTVVAMMAQWTTPTFTANASSGIARCR